MRTTLTIEDDLAAVLKERAVQQGVPFRRVVNQALRRGLGPVDRPGTTPPKTIPHHFGFRPGIDLDKLNQLVDEMEADAAATKLTGPPRP